jgi:hypothetical protein
MPRAWSKGGARPCAPAFSRARVDRVTNPFGRNQRWYRERASPYEVLMLARFAFALFLAAAPLGAQQPQQDPPQEEKLPKVPKDSLLVTIEGCLKGRVIRAYDVRQPDTTTGVEIRNKSFRVEGKKDMITDVKKNDGMHVEITGIIKKSALIEPGMKFKGGRVVVGGGTGVAGNSGTGGAPDPAENVVVLDAVTLTAFGNSCSDK